MMPEERQKYIENMRERRGGGKGRAAQASPAPAAQPDSSTPKG